MWCVLLGLFAGVVRTSAADFNVTSPSFSFTINGMSFNPVLTLVRGETYTFAVNTTPGPFGHPFRITNAPAGSVTGNNTTSGTITFRVPTNEAINVGYDCSIHRFGARILTVPPPTFRIVELSVGPSLVLKTAGTNWNLAPQYSTNLSRTNWFALTVQSNRFMNGTNETFCGRPPVSNAFIRVSATRN